MTPDILRRFDDQAQALQRMLGAPRAEYLDRQPAAGVWSAREHLAHLGRYQEIFRERLARIRAEDGPNLGRYRAPDDPGFAAWAALPAAALVARLNEVRASLVAELESLTDAELTRRGEHPLLGMMPVSAWIDFFLVHEAHHHYMALIRLREAMRDAPRA